MRSGGEWTGRGVCGERIWEGEAGGVEEEEEERAAGGGEVREHGGVRRITGKKQEFHLHPCNANPQRPKSKILFPRLWKFGTAFDPKEPPSDPKTPPTYPFRPPKPPPPDLRRPCKDLRRPRSVEG